MKKILENDVPSGRYWQQNVAKRIENKLTPRTITFSVLTDISHYDDVNENVKSQSSQIKTDLSSSSSIFCFSNG